MKKKIGFGSPDVPAISAATHEPVTGIDVRGVSVTYGGTRVLGPQDLSIAAGGVTVLIGANGAGKSTLLRAMGRLLAPNSGTITIAGHNVHTADTRALARVVAVLQQQTTIVSRLTVRQFVSAGRFPHSQGRLTVADHSAIDAALEFLSLHGLADRYLEQLSGGQRQRACIAMVLAQDTECILLDEPLAGLDMGHAAKLMQQIRAAADTLGKTVVWVEHDVNIAAAYADRMVALLDGQVVASGTPAEIMTPEVLQKVFDTPVEVFRQGDVWFANYFCLGA